MLSPPDADLVAREPDLPGLATLLDPEAFLLALASQSPGVRFDGAQVTYLRYRPREDGLVAYRMMADGRAVDAYGVAHRSVAETKLRNAREKRQVPGPVGPGRFVLDDRALVVSFFPNDGGLAILPDLADPGARHRVLRKIVPDREDLWKAELESVRYRPERRYSAKLVVEGRPRAFLKAYSSEDYSSASRGAKAFHATPTLHVSRRIGKSRSRRLLAFDWAEGRILEEALSDARFEDAEFAEIGRAVAALHAQSAAPLRVRSREGEAADLVKTAADLGYLWPPLAETAWDLARRIGSRILRGPSAATPIHGDLQAGHVLLVGEAVHVVDLDEAALGDPATDLGNFLAHLELESVRGNLAKDRVEAMGDAFLDGYGSASRARAGVATAAALLRLAIEPFRDRAVAWPEAMTTILERADEALRVPANTGGAR